MSSVQHLREFISERLTAAAEEIYSQFEKTIEEELERQRRLLETRWRPQIRLHRIDLQQTDVCKEGEVTADQQLCDQERNSSLDQEEPEPLRTEEDQEELYSGQEKKELALKQETDTFMLTPTYEGGAFSESEKKTVQLLFQTPSGPEEEFNADHVKRELGPNNEDSSLISEHDRNTKAGKRSLKCAFCGKGFQYKSKLVRHLMTHTGEKPYQCRVCGKLFRESSTLLRHMRSHTGERLFTCKTCKKTFTCLSGLKRHEITHTDRMPYFCQTCGKFFRESSTLLRHKRSHTGEGLFTCNTCKKTFTSLSGLKRHEMTCGKFSGRVLI